MNILLSRAAELLAETERALRALLEEGISRQSYHEVAEVAKIAAQLATISASMTGAADTGVELRTVPNPSARPSSREHLTHNDSRVPRVRPLLDRASPNSKATNGAVLGEGRVYPFFEREDDRLVKVGWSERDGRVYEHRAAKAVILRTCETIAHHGRKDKQFKMDPIVKELGKVPDPVPSYQAYLALAWLRSESVVDKDGKEGYRIKGGPLTTERLTDLWNRLSERA